MSTSDTQYTPLGLKTAWSKFESKLAELTSNIAFTEFRNVFCGVPVKNHKAPKNEDILAELIILVEKAMETPPHPASSREDLEWVEKWINLFLLLWRGSEDPHHEWRTVVHYLGWLDQSWDLKGGLSLAVYERGIILQFAKENLERRFPLIESMGSVLGNLPSRLEAHSNFVTFQNIYELILKINQLALWLIDEWEYSFACMSHTHVAVARLKPQNQTQALVRQSQLETLVLNRNWIARWAVQSLVDLQNWQIFAESQSVGFSKLETLDIANEVQASQRLILACIQKTFLPASITRHNYAPEVLAKYHKFFEIRSQIHTADFASAIVYFYFSHLLPIPEQPKHTTPSIKNIENLVSKKAFHWHLGFDPYAALRAFSWMAPKSLHKVGVGLYCYAMLLKAEPDPFPSPALQSCLDLAHSPEDFSASHPNRNSLPKWDWDTKELLDTLISKLEQAKNAYEPDSHFQEGFSHLIEYLRN